MQRLAAIGLVDHGRQAPCEPSMPVFSGVARVLGGRAHVVFSATPDNTGTRPAAASLMAAHEDVRFSAALSEQFSPTVPMQMTPFDAVIDERGHATFCVASRRGVSSRANPRGGGGKHAGPILHFDSSIRMRTFPRRQPAQVESGYVEFRRRAPGRTIGLRSRAVTAHRVSLDAGAERVQQIPAPMGPRAPDGCGR